MDESRNGRNTRNLILRVFLVYFLVSLFMLGWLLWPFLSTIVVAATVTGLNPLYQMLNRKLPSVGRHWSPAGLYFSCCSSLSFLLSASWESFSDRWWSPVF